MAKAKITLASVNLRETSGRYSAREQDHGYGRTAPAAHNRTAVRSDDGSGFSIATVDEPGSASGIPSRVLVNHRVDVLELERSHGRISEAAYRAGRLVQAVFEKQRGLRTTYRVELGTSDASSETIMAQQLDVAMRIKDIEADIEQAIGSYGRRMIRSLMIDNESFAGLAAKTGKSASYGSAYIGERFRSHLEEIADKWGAKGNEGNRIRGSRDGVGYSERARPGAAMQASRSAVTKDFGERALNALASAKGISTRDALRGLLNVD